MNNNEVMQLKNVASEAAFAAMVDKTDEQIAHLASQYGETRVFHWLITRGLVMWPELCSQAVYSKQFECLKWLRSIKEDLPNGGVCPWDMSTTEAAAADDTLDILEWLVENGCPIDEDAYHFAHEGDQQQTTAWLRKNYPHICPE